MENFIKIVSAVKDETRVMILRFLYTYGETCVCELQASFNMIQSRLSRHLLILKDAGFLKVRREGQWSYYSINAPLDAFKDAIIRQIISLSVSIPEKSSRC
ncbi:MAG: winged helix-turn-helix transcriptional regulator [Nitrospirae bacterium]|nr:winged helix-turn-helix transcriptional regulator [Nitrospirota bacterium]MBF0535818.1 winged helix-turn-helix transcriptional regulator [Nitrospirota bacterium]MBF0617717.1 winged helix-turn-helix transcriptional regulator [Nitrospirota bacterium]